MSEQDRTARRTPHAPVQPGTADRFFDYAPYQVWALDRDTREWLYLPDGAAALPVSRAPGAPTWKDRCRAGELLCPYPACGIAFGRVNNYRKRRHCFAHPPGVAEHNGAGAGETWWHLNAKQRMAAWARTKFPGAEVRVDDIQLRIEDQRRQPDVLVTMRDGRRLAVELQYSALDETEWTARHDFYRRAGIVDVWLLANTGPMFKRTTSHGHEAVRLLPLHQAMLRAGVIPLWFNPVWACLATAHTRRKAYLTGVRGVWASRAYELPPLATFPDCWLKIEDLDRSHLDWAAGELLTPIRRRHRQSQVTLEEEAAAARAAAAAAETAAAEAAARAAAERAAAEEAAQIAAAEAARIAAAEAARIAAAEAARIAAAEAQAAAEAPQESPKPAPPVSPRPAPRPAPPPLVPAAPPVASRQGWWRRMTAALQRLTGTDRG
ncbi:competence protein CoiA family protein [Krasilnikovia sp. MM14-A1259]|uniref:competence protein CoiA family protein n=1 Tax=Krasilnikovia sp. MM14-A1259 TaxID=3373539 RepID=UPI0038257CC1